VRPKTPAARPSSCRPPWFLTQSSHSELQCLCHMSVQWAFVIQRVRGSLLRLSRLGAWVRVSGPDSVWSRVGAGEGSGTGTGLALGSGTLSRVVLIPAVGQVPPDPAAPPCAGWT
jgi:hypothetical protein